VLTSPMYLPSDHGKMELIVWSVAAEAMLVCLGTILIYWK
jgi:hypothetical protein